MLLVTGEVSSPYKILQKFAFWKYFLGFSLPRIMPVACEKTYNCNCCTVVLLACIVFIVNFYCSLAYYILTICVTVQCFMLLFSHSKAAS